MLEDTMAESGGFHFAKMESAPAPVADKKSKLGSAAVTLGVLAVLSFALAMLLLNIESIKFSWQLRYTIREYIDGIMLAAYAFLCLSPLISLMGLGLGIAAIVQKQTDKKAGVMGLLINAVALVVPMCVLAVYLFAG
jgi:hypothetical protein